MYLKLKYYFYCETTYWRGERYRDVSFTQFFDLVSTCELIWLDRFVVHLKARQHHRLALVSWQNGRP